MRREIGAGGFTLVELMLSLALTGMVFALTLPFVHAQKRIWERQEQRRESRRALVGALTWLTRDVQQAGYHDAGTPLRLLEPGSVAFVVSRDEAEPTGFSPANRRLITIWHEGEDLKYRTQAPVEPPASGWERGSTQVLASGLAGMQCRGVDAAGAETFVPGAAALVECELTASDGRRAGAVVRLRKGAGGLPL